MDSSNMAADLIKRVTSTNCRLLEARREAHIVPHSPQKEAVPLTDTLILDF